VETYSFSEKVRHYHGFRVHILPVKEATSVK